MLPHPQRTKEVVLQEFFQNPIDKTILTRYNTDKPTSIVGFKTLKEREMSMKNYFLELLRRNFRFGRMCNSRTAYMAGCSIAPTVPL